MNHITYDERQTIERLHDQEYSLREIARRLGRHHRTVQQELRRNKGHGPYEADTAERKYRRRLYGKKEKKLHSNAMLREYVIEKLKEDWSPEQVSERLKCYDHRRAKETVSHETIYQFVYSQEGRSLRLFEHLRMGKPKRFQMHSRRRKIPIEGPSIHERPLEVSKKKVIGHWESDLMECRRGTGHISTNYERVAQLCRIERVKNKQAEEKYESLVKLIDSLPQPMVKTITFDRGTENACHRKLDEEFGVKSYFCDPYRSWQKGGVENLNKLLRQYIPKKSDLSHFTDEQLYKIQERLNNRPRKALKFFTPNEFSLYHTSGAFNT
jgi:IS30 family transposase